MKRGAEFVEDEKYNTERLCKVSYDGNIEEVKNALESSDVNVINPPNGLTPLMYACSRLDAGNAKDIVHLLIERGAVINATTFTGISVLQLAVIHSSVYIVSLLLENKAFVNGLDKNGKTPLHHCAHRRDDAEGLLICAKLAACGADIGITSQSGNTAFHTACKYNTLDMVLLFCGLFKGCASVLGRKKASALWMAGLNNMYGPEIIDYLITVQKLDVLEKREDQKSAFFFAIEHSGRTASALAKHISRGPLGLRKETMTGRIQGPDPISSYKAGLKVGWTLGYKPFDWLKYFDNPYALWAFVRVRCIALSWTSHVMQPNILPVGLTQEKADILKVLSQKEVPERIRTLLMPEILVARFGNRLDTLLHFYARNKDVVGLMSTMKQAICPFIRNVEYETPMDIAVKSQSIDIIRCLFIYSRWHPDETRTRWYGPYFRQRAKTFLLVAQRLGVFPKDIRLLIVRHIADCEDV